MLARPCLKTTPTLGKRAKNPQPIRVGFLVNGGGWLTMCRLASRAYEQWCGLLLAGAQLSEISG